ncbi:unnamed protein product, partial [Gulo gulo]|jgi:hypothetical protein
MCF